MENAVILQQSTIDNLTHEQLNYIMTHVKIDALKEEYKSRERDNSFCMDETINLWLAGKANKTAQVYTSFLDIFVTWIGKTHPLRVGIKDSIAYMEYLKSLTWSPNSILLGYSAVSSFYKFLVLSGYINVNPFEQVRNKPVRERSKELLVPSEAELDILEQEFTKVPKMKLAFSFMRYQGVRVGIFSEGILINDTRFVSHSKGKRVTGILNPTTDAILKSGATFDGVTSSAVSKAFARKVRELCEKGLLEATYSCHDIRHAFAVKDYQEHNDIYRTSRLLNHNSIKTTQVYLESLDVDYWERVSGMREKMENALVQ